MKEMSVREFSCDLSLLCDDYSLVSPSLTRTKPAKVTRASFPHILSTVSYNPKVIPNYMENALIPGEPRRIAQPF